MNPKTAREIKFPTVSTLHGLSAQARVQPETVTIFKGWTRLTTDAHGEMDAGPTQGFFCAETRLITGYRIRLNGKPVSHRFSAQLAADEWASTGAILKSGDSGNLPEGTLPKGAIEVRLLRRCDGGLAERIFVKNNGVPSRRVHFELSLACPILDSEYVEEMKKGKRGPTTGVRPKLSEKGEALVLRFERKLGKRSRTPTIELSKVYPKNAPQDGDEVQRGVEIRIVPREGGPRTRIRIEGGKKTVIHAWATLGAREELCLELAYEPVIDGLRIPAPPLDGLSPLPRETTGPVPRLAIRSGSATFDQLVGQAMSDLPSLKLPLFGEPGIANPERYVGYLAGIPRYVGLFGRDTVIAGWQSLLFDPDGVEPALSRVALFQGQKKDDWRDEEPDRMPHERRLDPQSAIGKLNRNLYYGDVTSTPFWILALSSLHQWTGERDLIRRHQRTLERCCEWVLRRLERGNDLIYYAPADPDRDGENRNQAWKDSGDAIVDEDGRIRMPPLALAEIQGYAYQALIEVQALLGRVDSSMDPQRIQAAADRLKEKFNRVFWLPEEKFYALAVDGREKPLGARASNIGHCLRTGILDASRTEDVVRGLMAADLFSGWGIRTLSADNPGFDPFSYHRGSVWPVENAIIAEGLSHLGYAREANRIVAGQLSLAAIFPQMRLPEVFGGQARSAEFPIPGMYNFANLLQTWSVSAVAQFVQTILGIRPRADLGTLYLDPQLPEWLPWIEIENLRIGTSELKLRFDRESDGRSSWRILSQKGDIRIMGGRFLDRKDPEPACAAS